LYTYTYVNTYIENNTALRAENQAYIYIYIYIYIYVYICIYTYTHRTKHIYIYMYLCMYVYIYIYIYIYTYTHTYIQNKIASQAENKAGKERTITDLTLLLSGDATGVVSWRILGTYCVGSVQVCMHACMYVCLSVCMYFLYSHMYACGFLENSRDVLCWQCPGMHVCM
jgi:hypothetical protein